MERSDLVRNLEKGNSLGFNTKNAFERVAWVILSKRKPIHRFFQLFEESDNPELYHEQLNIVKQPFQIWSAALSRSVFDGDRFPNNEDYLTNQTFFFADIDSIIEFLAQMDLRLDDIKWSSEIEFL